MFRCGALFSQSAEHPILDNCLNFDYHNQYETSYQHKVSSIGNL